MPALVKPERIRDPLHNLIEFEFRSDDQLEHVVWRALQTRPFQRLRRIRQLGFSDLVYPGTTHTRFAHSVGVFHTARRLTGIIHRQPEKATDGRIDRAKDAYRQLLTLEAARRLPRIV